VAGYSPVAPNFFFQAPISQLLELYCDDQYVFGISIVINLKNDNNHPSCLKMALLVCKIIFTIRVKRSSFKFLLT